MSDQIRRGPLRRSYTRREVIRGAVGTGAALSMAPLLAACGGGSSSSSGGSSGGGGGPITIGSFSDPAMVPFRDDFLPKYQQETGITVKYNETNYDAWYQNCKNDGLQKTGAYDIYVMDDNWVPEFAAASIVQSLDKLGLKVNPDIRPKGLDQGYWPPKSGPRLKAFADATPELYSLVIIDDVRDALLQQRPLQLGAGQPGTTSTPSPRRPSRPTCTAGRRAAWPATRSCRPTCRC